MNWQHALKDYQDYLRLERGLTENSIVNYSLDIRKLEKWLNQNEIAISPIAISEETVRQFIYEIAKTMNPRSQSRIISGLKGFFNYLFFEDYRRTNPVELILSSNFVIQLPDTWTL